jgi:uncharacterized protein
MTIVKDMRTVVMIGAISVLCAAAALSAHDLPRPTGWVNDFADVVPEGYRTKLEALITEVEAKTSAEIFVVTVSSIAPYDEKSYGRRLFDSWKPGKKGRDNGVLILVAVKERRWRIEVGYGLEGILPDGVCGDIGRSFMVPYLKDGDYGKALYHGVVAIARRICDDVRVKLASAGEVSLEHDEICALPVIYLFAPIFVFLCGLYSPFFAGLSCVAFAVIILFHILFPGSTILGFSVIIAYLASLAFKFCIWWLLPPAKRKDWLKGYRYDSWHSHYDDGYFGGGFGGGGFGGGGFGGSGGRGGGGGAGGGF